jgi:hypothetical protein
MVGVLRIIGLAIFFGTDGIRAFDADFGLTDVLVYHYVAGLSTSSDSGGSFFRNC